MYAFPTLGKNTKDLDCFAIFKLLFFMFFFPQILQAEKDNQEMQHQLQLSELMNKHAKEMRDLG